MNGLIIKELRQLKNISQPELAKNIGVSNGTISFWENGQNEPKASYIKRLSNYFGVTTDYLLYGSKNQTFDNSCNLKSNIQEVIDKLNDEEQKAVLRFALFLAQKNN